MKIIKEGNIPHFKGTCDFCGCEVECDKSDGTIIYSDFTTLIIWCPTVGCGKSIKAYPVVSKLKKKRK